MAKTNRQKQGDLAEQQALAYLKQHNLALITKNYFTHFGEIDIIMLDKQISSEIVLVFIEVRYRTQDDYGEGFETVDIKKQSKIIRSAQIFLQQYPKYENFICRFDVISVQSKLKYQQKLLFWCWQTLFPGPQQNITWLKNAFELS